MNHYKRSFQPRSRGPRQRFSPFRRKQTVDVSRFVKKASAVQQEKYVAHHSFADFPFSDVLKQNITLRGYKEPTPIQDKAIPEIISGKDVVGIANTGTGKTAAFLLPLIQKIQNDRLQKVLIIVPTRELAMQIEDEFRAFARTLNIFSVLCIGGLPMGRQIYALRRSPQVIIGTPGRLKDLERRGGLVFGNYRSIVLDEVDRMLDMGFIQDITYIISKLPKPRHSLFFSATIPSSVHTIMHQFLTNPVTISVKIQESSNHVNQDIVKINGKAKIEVLHDLLIQKGFDKVLLFGRTKWGIEKLFKNLIDRGFKAAAIHGDKRQSQRMRALEAFKRNQVQILLATDIASRGIDVSNVTHVINYDLPESYEDYIHRIGRTGRADKFGTALTFVD